MEHVVLKYGLIRHIQFNSMVKKCLWDESNQYWSIEINSNHKLSNAKANYLMVGVGPLNVPLYPSINGVRPVDGNSKFKGNSFHSSQWQSSCVFDQSKTRVAIIGTGASAIQIIPEIAKSCASLHVFQRTPPWIYPKPNFNIPSYVKRLFVMFPFILSVLRWLIYVILEIHFLAWTKGSIFNVIIRHILQMYIKFSFRGNISSDKYESSSLTGKSEDRKRGYGYGDGIGDGDGDKNKASEYNVTPPYAPGCKRILFSSEYYSTLQQSHVHLVNRKISSITSKGVVVKKSPSRRNDNKKDGNIRAVSDETDCNDKEGDEEEEETIELDVIIYATGFQTNRQFITQENTFDIYGKNGESYVTWLQKGPKAYLGVTAEQFPNMFILFGPNTALAHTSVLVMIECQVNYILDLMMKMKAANVRSITVKEDVLHSYYKGMFEVLKTKVFIDRYLCE